MAALVRLFRVRNKDGQALVEYGLILTLIVVVVLIVLIVMGNQVHNMYCNIGGSFPG
ncbi:MAG: Flp/Fap pilin component [Chloroflexota bacterium]|jgi:Flp pilus assembly pilin Flp|nr:Flp/Fap pilin component [Chloroflexota bacterium]